MKTMQVVSEIPRRIEELNKVIEIMDKLNDLEIAI